VIRIGGQKKSKNFRFLLMIFLKNLNFLWQGLTYIDQTAILDPISHLLPVKVDPLPLAITSPHSITVFKQDSVASDITDEPIQTEPAPNIQMDRTPTVTSVGLSNLEDTNHLQPKEEPKPGHF
jgi:hypothetical protein